MGSPSIKTFFDELINALRVFPSVPRYELYCHPSVHNAVRQASLANSRFDPPGMGFNSLFGVDIIIAPELGQSVWELYADRKLIDYGKVTV